MALESWGRLPTPAAAREERRWSRRGAALPATALPLLAYGNGRSYGDVCLNAVTPAQVFEALQTLS